MKIVNAVLAVLLLANALPVAAQREAHDRLAAGLLDLAETYALAGQFDRAVATLEHGRAIAALEDGARRNRTRLEIALGTVLIRKSFHTNGVDERAHELFAKAHETAREIGDDALLAEALYHLGHYEFKQGEEAWDRALATLAEALAAGERSGDRLAVSQALFTTGVIHQRRGALERADPLFQRSLAEARAVKSRFMEAENERHIGYQYYLRGDLDGAMDHFLVSLSLRRSIGYRDGAIFAAITVGQTLDRQKKVSDAIRYLEEARSEAESMGSPLGLARACASLGEIYHRMGRIDDARSSLRRAVEVARSIGYGSVERSARELLEKIDGDAGQE